MIPLSLTCGVTGDGCLSPGSGASFDTEDVLAAGDNANIIFGAMYDESVTDQATITDRKSVV